MQASVLVHPPTPAVFSVGTSPKRQQPLSPQFSGNTWKNYYKRETQDFDALVQDFEDKHWKVSDLNWTQDIRQNMAAHINGLSPAQLEALAKQALPLAKDDPKARQIAQKIADGGFPADAEGLAELKSVLLERQMFALRQIANHALSNEQASVAPLSKGIALYRRWPSLQEAQTTFVRDEAKHSTAFKKYLTEKLGGKPEVAWDTIAKFTSFSVLPMFSPGMALFLALSVETVGGSFFEFFAEHSPEPLLKEMCQKIAKQDERRHMDICKALYKELVQVKDPQQHPLRARWEKLRNNLAMRLVAKELYGEQAQGNHYLMQAAQALGMDHGKLLSFIAIRIKEEFAQIGFDFKPEQYLPKT